MIWFFNGTYNYSLSDGHHVDPHTIFDFSEKSKWIDIPLSKVQNLQKLIDVLKEVYASPARVNYIFLGTDNLEELAFLISMTAPEEKLVILSGSMRPLGHPEYDGFDNFQNATAAGKSELGLESGCLVVMGGRVFDGKTVRKRHSTSLTAFGSPEGALAMWLGGGRWNCVGSKRNRGKVYSLDQIKLNANIPILTVALFGDLNFICTDSLDGLVVAGSGTGTIPIQARERLVPLAKKVPIVISTRCYAGPNYNDEMYPGSAGSYEKEGFILRGYEDLNPLQARFLLMAQLGSAREKN